MAATNAAPEYKDITGYDAARREQKRVPPGFVMHGESFVGEPVLRTVSVLDYLGKLGSQVEGVAYIGFLHDQLQPESWKRFDAMMLDRSRPVDDGMLERAVHELLRQYTGRPTKESSSSARTPSKRGKSSKVGSSSKAPALRSA